MSDLRDDLLRVIALAEKATPGPWRRQVAAMDAELSNYENYSAIKGEGHLVVDAMEDADAETVCALRNLPLDALLAAVEDADRREQEGFANGIQFITNKRPPSSRTHDGANTLNELREIGAAAIAAQGRKALPEVMGTDEYPLYQANWDEKP